MGERKGTGATPARGSDSTVGAEGNEAGAAGVQAPGGFDTQLRMGALVCRAEGGWGEGEEADVQMDTQTEPSGPRSDGRKGGGGEVGVRGGEGVVEETRGVDRGRGRQAQDSLRSQPTHTQRAIAHAMAVHVGGWRQRGGWLAWRGEQGESARMLWLPVGLVEEESLGEASFQDMLSREVVGDRGCAARV